MLLGIDASNLRAGGSLTHLVELLRAAVPAAHGFERIVVWAGAATLEAIEERRWLRKSHDPLLDRALPYRLFWQRFRVPRLAALAGCDVLWVPGGSTASSFRPMVTMSRNMLPFEWREMRRNRFAWRTLKNLLLHFAQRSSFRRAEGLIFLSRYARDAVIGFAGDKTKVTIIPHGIESRFSCRPRAQQPIGEYTTDKPFRLLYVSIVDVHKHQWHVADAVARLRTSGLPVAVDLVGPAHGPALAKLNATLRRVDPTRQFVRYVGAVPHRELHRFYAAADLNIFASSCENMPNILLEAMAAGLPIACSRRGPMPEILGEAGIYFDPERPDEIADAIRRLIESPDLRREKAEAAFERSADFSWARCARETLAFLAEVVDVDHLRSKR
ncbi:MAG: glycosyltransferase family 1 protein [Gemmatimonadaceae bacterium]